MNLSQHRRRFAFILSEVLTAMAIFGISAGASMLALNQMNHRAAVARCQTGASTVAQNQIDLILSVSPFNPKRSQIPPSLTVGTTNQGSPEDPTLPIYTDPKTNQVVVNGWMSTLVERVNPVHAGTGTELEIYRATVQVWYRFKGRIYPPVTMTTMRCSDT